MEDGGNMDHSIARLAAGAAGASTLAELADSTLAPLKQLTGAGHAVVYCYDQGGQMVALGGDTWIGEVYWPYWAEDPTQAETRRIEHRPGLALADRLVGRRRLQRSRAYLEFYRPCELEHLCCVFLTALAHGTPGMTNLFLARGPKQQPYEQRDVALIQHVMPILSAAVQRLLRMPRNGFDGEQALLDWGRQQACVAASLDGRIQWISPAARTLLGDALPARLSGALTARLRARSGPAARAHWRLPDGRLLRVDLAPAPALDGDCVLLLLSAVTAATDHTLSPAEIHVMECLAAGNSTLAIAGILSLSEATVRTHLRNIYRKLRVGSRTEAVLAWHAMAERTASLTG
jgi:DNA-binding CsgD family transcriptional regulator